MESLERMHSDRVQPPYCSRHCDKSEPEAALMHGMSVYAANRTPNVTQLYNELYGGGGSTITPTLPIRSAPTPIQIPQPDRCFWRWR